MNVIGHDIGEAVDALYEQLQRRLHVEAERELAVEASEQEALSNVRWGEEAVTVLLHPDVPTHALAHVFAVALQHLRQRLDRYPDVRRPPGAQTAEAPMLRQALRELVLAPEAEMQLESLELDQQWELEQRHAGLKEMLRAPPEDWNEAGSAGNAFMALHYARFALSHPPEMWEGLRKTFTEQLPAAAGRGEVVVKTVRGSGWGTPGACLQSLLAVRDELELGEAALIEDRRTAKLL